MKIMIAEDDPISRRFLFKFLSKYALCDLTVDGFEALDAYLLSLKENDHYDLICLDVMMPKFDGLKVLKAIRDIEIQKQIKPEKQTKVILTTALDKLHFTHNATELSYDAFVSKPIDTHKLIAIMQNMGLVDANAKGG